MKATILVLAVAVLVATNARAQSVEGDWQGTLKAGAIELRIVAHLLRDDKGGLKGTLDSPDQGQSASGLPMASVTVADSTLKFEVPAIGGSYEGKIDGGATALTGMWKQGPASLPLNFTRAAAVQARTRVPKPSDIDGDWSGTLSLQGMTLNIVLHLTTYEDGLGVKMDIPDANAIGLPATSASRDAATVKLELKQIGAGFSGTLGQDGASISGTWGQLGNFQPLVLKRAAK